MGLAADPARPSALARAEQVAAPRGPYVIQAQIAACHARARTNEETDWASIASLYGELARIASSPVIELNRAVAVSMASGPAAGLELVDGLQGDPALSSYHLLPSVRGDLLEEAGRLQEARAEFERAASITRNVREKELLLGRARECASGQQNNWFVAAAMIDPDEGVAKRLSAGSLTAPRPITCVMWTRSFCFLPPGATISISSCGINMRSCQNSRRV